MNATLRWEGQVLALHEAAAQLRPDAFFSEALGSLQRLLGHDAACIGEGRFDLATGAEQIEQIDLIGRPLAKLADRVNFLGPDPTLVQGLQNPGRLVQFDVTDNPAVTKRPDLVRHAKAFEVHHTLTLVAPRGSGRIEVMTLWRGARRPYRPDQARAAQLLASHLLLARRTCYRLQAANAATADGAAPVRAHAFCSADGRIHFAAPGFHTLLQLVWPDASHWMLPRALLPGLQGAPVPPVGPISVQVAPLGNLFQVSLQRQRVGLNPAEQAVAALVARHLSDKAIARQLNKSPATVRNQLHAIYQRLGLSGRMALADWVRTANASDGR